MKLSHVSFFCAFVTAISLFSSGTALAADAETKATDAVTAILFKNHADEFATYRVNDEGEVDIVFARNTPDLTYTMILNQLKHHPDISSVLAGKGGPNCSLFH